MKKINLVSTFILFFSTIGFSQITDIKSFLNQCPTLDPNINTILNDFEIRLNGVKVTDFPCSEPVSAIPVADYTNPLIYLQTLRVIYYMDRYLAGNHLPWTDKYLYDWMRDNVDGVDIRDGVSGGYCCDVIDGKKLFVTGNPDDSNREFDKTWRGISGNITFFAHEVRHADPGGYYHSSCCGIANGCDNFYNENDLGAYGVQYWLDKSWLKGDIYVGAKISHTPSQINDIVNWHLSSLNGSRVRFCNEVPEIVHISDIDNPLGEISILTTSDITNVTESTATSGGIITFDNNVSITERGICWSESQSPTLSDNFVNCGTGNGQFACELTGLMPNTKYYVRAYATNLFGTAFGNEISFESYLTGTAQNAPDAIFMYPNPSNHTLYLAGTTNECNIIMYDLTGKIVIRSKIAENGIDIHHLQNGMYFVRIEMENGIVEDIVVKQ